MKRSIEFWLSQAVGQITPAIKPWAECYPLPIGEAAARHLFIERGQNYPDGLTRLLPFQGVEEAYWALRVENNRSVLDMFGLRGPAAWGDWARDYLWLGAFAYSLRGRDDMSLVRLMQHGEAWWRDFSWKKIQGRPRGSGHWESREHFERELTRAGGELRAKGRKVTQEEVATLLQSDDRVLRHWLKAFGIDWREVKKRF